MILVDLFRYQPSWNEQVFMNNTEPNAATLGVQSIIGNFVKRKRHCL